ncbi:MAG: hypothetical protein ACX94B_07620 [Henriciella sp.]|nr:hypothetical protein [Hyphomonadaceae bacterium]
MSKLEDQVIPLSALTFESDAVATATAEAWDVVQVGVLLQAVVQNHASTLLDDGSLHTVSVTFDASSEAISGSDVRFESRIDRKTRTLVFASGLASQGDRHLLKATVVFRIA